MLAKLKLSSSFSDSDVYVIDRDTGPEWMAGCRASPGQTWCETEVCVVGFSSCLSKNTSPCKSYSAVPVLLNIAG